jgi:hypothetical protein
VCSPNSCEQRLFSLSSSDDDEVQSKFDTVDRERSPKRPTSLESADEVLARQMCEIQMIEVAIARCCSLSSDVPSCNNVSSASSASTSEHGNRLQKKGQDLYRPVGLHCDASNDTVEEADIRAGLRSPARDLDQDRSQSEQFDVNSALELENSIGRCGSSTVVLEGDVCTGDDAVAVAESSEQWLERFTKDGRRQSLLRLHSDPSLGSPAAALAAAVETRPKPGLTVAAEIVPASAATQNFTGGLSPGSASASWVKRFSRSSRKLSAGRRGDGGGGTGGGGCLGPVLGALRRGVLCLPATEA